MKTHQYLKVINSFIVPFFNIRKMLKTISGICFFLRDLSRYKKLSISEQLEFSDMYPCLFDKTVTTGIDPHYFYQGIWLFKKVIAKKPIHHIDVGSKLNDIGLLSTIVPVTFIDIRPPEVDVNNFFTKNADILNLPYESNSIESLSCMHVVEHIGLGRYGDKLDPEGTKKACMELSRVLKPGGTLLFSTPIGENKVCFNAHRLHSIDKILSYFSGLKLSSFSCVTDNGKYMENVNTSVLNTSKYACGMFEFTKTL